MPYGGEGERRRRGYIFFILLCLTFLLCSVGALCSHTETPPFLYYYFFFRFHRPTPSTLPHDPSPPAANMFFHILFLAKKGENVENINHPVGLCVE